MQVTVSLCADWRKRLSPEMIEAMTPITKDPIGREIWICDREHADFLREISLRDAGTQYVFRATIRGSALAEGECRDQQTESLIIVRREVADSPLHQTILVSSRSLIWAAAAMFHVLTGEHFAIPFAVSSLSIPSGSYSEVVAPLERLVLVSVLAKYDWHCERTADALGICRQTLYNRMLALDIDVELIQQLWRRFSAVERVFLASNLAG